MSEYETVKYRQEAAVALITLHRPESMNAFNQQMRRDLAAALVRAASNSAVRAVVLTGEGRCFCAGADLKDGASEAQSIQQILQTEYRPAFDCIASMNQPVIAAVGGSAAGIGLSLALVGLYAVIAYSAARRVREFAIRLAIGATRGAVVRLVLRDGIVIAGIGIAIGLLVSVPLGRLLGTAFVGLGPLSPWVFALAPAAVIALTLAACLVPAWRASMVEPVAVLRLE